MRQGKAAPEGPNYFNGGHGYRAYAGRIGCRRHGCCRARQLAPNETLTTPFLQGRATAAAQIVRAAALTCSRNQLCARSSLRRGCQVMKYGKGLISLGGSTKRTPLSG